MVRAEKRIPRPLLFSGEIIALGLCWCPSTILYNYLTYFLMTAGILLLYRGICRKQAACFVAAGICLGANVAVRMPNVVQAAFILAVWYGIVITDTARCDAAAAAGTEAPVTKGEACHGGGFWKLQAGACLVMRRALAYRLWPFVSDTVRRRIPIWC